MTQAALLMTTLAPTRARPLRAVLAVVGGAALITLATRIQVPMWPVPMTMQSFAVLLVAMTLGLRLGAGAVALYLVQGAAGLPVFAAGGGIAYLMGPTAGYLWGFLAAAVVAGALADRGMTRHMAGALLIAMIGMVLIHALGAAWLAGLVGWEKALLGGVYPFVLGDVIKSVLLALVLPSAWRILAR